MNKKNIDTLFDLIYDSETMTEVEVNKSLWGFGLDPDKIATEGFTLIKVLKQNIELQQSHDTHLADVDRLLDVARWSLRMLDSIVELHPKTLPRLGREAKKLARQTYTELREIYKEKK